MNPYPITKKVKELTNSHKRNFYLMTSNQYFVTTGWSGGSRSYYSLIDFKTGKPLEILGAGDNFSKRTTAQEMPMNALLIETTVFCGKSGVPRLMCRPEQESEVKQWLGLDNA